jgi:hypothetical protein
MDTLLICLVCAVGALALAVITCATWAVLSELTRMKKVVQGEIDRLTKGDKQN